VTIGLRFSATQLGYYNRGYQLLMRPLNQLRAPTTSVALPVLRMIREDVPRTDAFLIRGQRALGYSLVAAIAVVAGAAHPIVVIFLGERWSSVAPVFALLAVAGIFQTISYVANWVYLARGLTGKLVWYSMVSLAIKIVCVLVGSHWGIVGVAAGFAVAPALAWPISIWWLARLTPLPVRGLYVGAGRILGCAALSGAATYATVQALSSLGAGVQLAAGGCVGAAVYGLLAVAVPAVRADAVDVFAIARRAVSRRSR
jgi:PST family polysaccharide transporter